MNIKFTAMWPNNVSYINFNFGDSLIFLWNTQTLFLCRPLIINPCSPCMHFQSDKSADLIQMDLRYK